MLAAHTQALRRDATHRYAVKARPGFKQVGVRSRTCASSVELCKILQEYAILERKNFMTAFIRQICASGDVPEYFFQLSSKERRTTITQATVFFSKMKDNLNRVLSLGDGVQVLESATSVDMLLKLSSETLCKVLRCDRATLWIAPYDEKLPLWSLIPQGKQWKLIELPKEGKSLTGECFRTRKPLLIDDARLDKRFDRSTAKKVGYRTLSVLCAPIFDGSRCVAVVQALNPISTSSAYFDAEDVFAAFLLGLHSRHLLVSLREENKTKLYLERQATIGDSLDWLGRELYKVSNGKHANLVRGLLGRQTVGVKVLTESLRRVFPKSREPRIFLVHVDFVLHIYLDEKESLQEDETRFDRYNLLQSKVVKFPPGGLVGQCIRKEEPVWAGMHDNIIEHNGPDIMPERRKLDEDDVEHDEIVYAYPIRFGGSGDVAENGRLLPSGAAS